jgi:hypothetical protein
MALAIALVDEFGRTLPGFTEGHRTLIMGEDGPRYRIVVHNATAHLAARAILRRGDAIALVDRGCCGLRRVATCVARSRSASDMIER